MRTILFRGKRLDNGEWVEGGCLAQYYGTDENKANGIYAQSTLVKQGSTTQTATRKSTGETFAISEIYEIDPLTVGQFTGLADKNGKKIFEGDIVRYQFDNDDCPFPNKRTDKIVGGIFFSVWRASFSITAGRNGSDTMNNDLYRYIRNGNRAEIIGNIHDNPELLETSNPHE